MGCAANGKALENKALLAETERTVEDLRGAVDQSRQQTKRFQDEHDAALRERDEALSELQDFHSHLKLQGEVSDSSELHELRGQLREAEANLGQECSRRCRMENRVTLLEGESRALRDELIAASAVKVAERKASEKFRQDLGARDAVLTELRARASQLASEHQDMAAERDDLAAELERLSTERDRAREELQEALRKAEASAALAAVAEAAAAEATAAAAVARSDSPSPGDSSKLMPLSSSSGRRTPVRSPRGDSIPHQQAEGRPPRAPGSSGRKSSAPSPSPEPSVGTAPAGPAGPPLVAERKRSSRKTVTRASLSSGVNVPRNSSDFIEPDGAALVQSDAGMAVKAKRRSKGKGKGDARAETKAPSADDKLAIDPEARPVQNSTAPSGRRSRSGSVPGARTTGSVSTVSTVDSHDGTSTTASTGRSGHAGAVRRADKSGAAERARPVAPWDDDTSSEEENQGSAGNVPATSSARVSTLSVGSARPSPRGSLPTAPGSARPSPRQSLSAPWDEPDEDPQQVEAGSRPSSRRPSPTPPLDEQDQGRQRPSQTMAPGSRPGSRRPSTTTAPWDEPDEGRRRPSQTAAGSRPASRRPSTTVAPWDEPDEGQPSAAELHSLVASLPSNHSGRQRQSSATPPGSRPGSRRPSTAVPRDEPDQGPAIAITAPWDEVDESASDSGPFQPAPRPKPKVGQAGTAGAPTSASAPASAPAPTQGAQLNGKAGQKGTAGAPTSASALASAPAPTQGAQLNGKAKTGAAKALLTKSSAETSPAVKAKAEPHENPSVQVFRFDFSVFDFLKHEVLQSPRDQVPMNEFRGSSAVGSPPVMLGAVPRAPLFSARSGGGSPVTANKAVPKLNLNMTSKGSDLRDHDLAATMSEVRPLPRKESTPPEIVGTPTMDDDQESLGDEDWPPQARRSSAPRRA